MNESQDYQQDQQMEELYKDIFPQAARMVKKFGGDEEQAKDIFHDALIIYLEKTQQPGFDIISDIKVSPGAYIMGIARLLSMNALKKGTRILSMESAEEALSVPEDFYLARDRKEKDILEHLKMVGSKCIQLLKAFYYDNAGMQELAKRFGFTNSRSATVQKYKCLEKVREEVKKGGLYEEVIN